MPSIQMNPRQAIKSRDGYWVRRFKRHIRLAAGAFALVWLVYLATPPPDIRHRLSMGTAYAGAVYLAATLALGPWNLFRKRPNPVSFDLRRDMGIWTGALAIVHTGIGLTVHLRGRMWMYFFKRLHPPALQTTQFGLANFVGLGATLLFLLLLGISNDLSLRAFGTRRWKSFQRWTYLALVLTAVHGIAYQLVEKRHLPWVLFFSFLVVFVLAIQLLGAIWTQGGFARRSRLKGPPN